MKTILFLAFLFLMFTGIAGAQTQPVAVASWTDNSNNEDGFRFYGWKGGPAETGQKQLLATTAASVANVQVQFPGNAGEQWCFTVAAFNSAGESSLAAPACKTVPVIINVPAAPGQVIINITVP